MFRFWLLVLALTLTTTQAQTPTPPDTLPRAIEALNAQLGARYTAADFSAVTWTEMQFSDSSLGCPIPGLMYMQVITPGYQFTLTVDGQSYDVRTNRAGTTAVVCGGAVSLTDRNTINPDTILNLTEINQLQIADQVTGQLAWAGETLILARDSEGILLYPAGDPITLPEVIMPEATITALATYTDPEGTVYLAVGTSDHLIRYQAIEPMGETALELQLPDEHPITALALGPNLIASSTLSGVQVWDATSGGLLAEIPTPFEVTALALSSNERGSSLAAGLVTGAIERYQITGDEEINIETLAPLEGHQRAISDLAFALDGAVIVSSSMDGTARVWDLLNNLLSVVLARSENLPITRIAINQAENLLLLGDESGQIEAWSLIAPSDPQLIQIFPAQGVAIVGLAFSPDDTWIVSSDRDGIIRLWGIGATSDQGAIRR